MAQNAKYYLSLYLIQVILSYNVLTIIQSVQDTGHFFHCTELSIAQSSHIGGWWAPRTESKEGTSLSVTVGRVWAPRRNPRSRQGPRGCDSMLDGANSLTQFPTNLK